MNKQEILNRFSNDEDKLLVSKILDKYQYSVSKNKISYTNFMNMAEKEIAKKIISSQKIKNYIFYGGFDECERSILIFYPEKFDLSIVEKNYDNFIGVLRIELPKDLFNTYEHRNYLSAIIKLGVSREKIGDILVFDNGADIIASKDILEFLYSNLSNLTRFQKSNILTLSIKDLRIKEQKKELFQIIIPSLRLDSVVSELCHTSRTKACEIISSEKVFVNYTSVVKTNTFLKENDTVTIRKYGKFIINQILGNTKKGNIILELQKYT